VPARTGSSPPAEPAPAYLSELHADLAHIAPALRHVVGVVQSCTESRQEVARLRAESDGVKTKLAAATSEVSLVDEQRAQLARRLESLQRQQQEEMAALRKDLEAKTASELAATRQEIAQAQQRDLEREVQAFEARQQDVIGKALDQELELKGKELAQLTQELDLQAREMADRLSQLQASPEALKSLERATSQALAKQQAALETRRKQAAAERTQLMQRQRGEFLETLKQQQEASADRRLKTKEASLRSAMAELLSKTEREDEGELATLRAALEEINQRHARLVQQQALWRTRMDEAQRELDEKAKRLDRLEAERQAALAKLEAAFQKPDPAVRPEALGWFGRAIRYMPPDAAAELTPLQQRLVAAAEQERKLATQRRIVRERQLALELSREMEAKHQEIRRNEQRQQEARMKRAEELLAKASQHAGRSEFDEALKLLSQAQALNPPQLAKIAILREELLAAKARRQHEAQAAQLEELFNRAMAAFEDGRYEEAVTLFEQVIEQEARLSGQQASRMPQERRQGS
jgi:hypothetical protein